MPDPCFPGSQAPFQVSYFTSGVSAVLVIIITTGNALIILAVARDPKKKLRTPFAYFLVNGALSDLIVGVVAMPVSTHFHYMEAKKLIDKTSIYILHLTYFVSASASLFSMAAMCFDRYYALVSLSTYRRKFTMRRCVVISICIWILAGGFSGFYFLVGYVSLLLIYINVSLITSFGITLLTYLKIMRNMRGITKTVRHGMNTTKKQSKEDRMMLRERKVTRVFMSILVTFMCIYAPALVLIYILQFWLSFSCDTRHIFRDLVFLLISAGSAANPIVCIVKLSTIKESIRAVIKCKKRNVYTLSTSDANESQAKKNIPKEQNILVLKCSARQSVGIENGGCTLEGPVVKKNDISPTGAPNGKETLH